jgi:hypothetical protein
MGSRWVTALLTVLVIAGTTGGVIASSGGAVLHRGGNAVAAQYGTPQGQNENNGSKTCRDLVKRHRVAERGLRARNTRYVRRYRGQQRAAILKYLRAQERSLHNQHVTAELQCRANGGA